MDDSQRIHDKWIAFGIWISLLAAIIYTSWHGILATVGLYSVIGQLVGDIDATFFWLLAELIMLLLGVFYLSTAWRKFSRITSEFLIQFAIQTDDRGSVFHNLLKFDDHIVITNSETPDSPDAALAVGSMAGSFIRSLAAVWIWFLLSTVIVGPSVLQGAASILR